MVLFRVIHGGGGNQADLQLRKKHLEHCLIEISNFISLLTFSSAQKLCNIRSHRANAYPVVVVVYILIEAEEQGVGGCCRHGGGELRTSLRDLWALLCKY